jgi:hypothetical protein
MLGKLAPRAALALAGALTGCAALAEGHYIGGVEGIQGASVPPPGVYFQSYLVNYDIRSFQAPGSNKRLPSRNTGTITASANGLVWISPYQFLGADYGVQAIVPVLRVSLDLGAAGVSDRRTGVGDIYLSPLLLAWHAERWDTTVAVGAWLDNGTSSGPAKLGKGYAATMLTAGATYYFDPARTLTASALTRYEFNGRNDAGLRPGDQLTLEWSLAKRFDAFQAGLVGYSQWQTTGDRGAAANGRRTHRHALGAEIVYPVPSAGLTLKGAFYKEVYVQAGLDAQPKGNVLRFTLIKAF